MKLKKILCMACLSAAVALTGIPQGAAALVHAEETQMAGLDTVIRQIYALYQNGDYAAMYVLDADAATAAYAEQINASGSDRFVIDLDGTQKAMMYVAPNGGYWWYFGTMENNLRQGQGTTIIMDSDYYEMYTGTYAADYPGGNGTYSIHWYDSGIGYDISGSFQGTQLNGAYQVNAAWVDEGAAYTGSLPITYTNSIITTVSGWECEVWPDEYYTTYMFYNDSAEDILFDVDSGYTLAAVCMTPDGYSGHWWGKGDVSERFSSVFYGNAAAAVPVVPEVPAAPEIPTPAPEQQTPAEPQTPVETVPALETVLSASTGTYVVERGDNLCRIAQKVYGDKKYWKNIYEANKGTIKSDYMIWANQVLTIPTLRRYGISYWHVSVL